MSVLSSADVEHRRHEVGASVRRTPTGRAPNWSGLSEKIQVIVTWKCCRWLEPPSQSIAADVSGPTD
jgi:hypothetical protein